MTMLWLGITFPLMSLRVTETILFTLFHLKEASETVNAVLCGVIFSNSLSIMFSSFSTRVRLTTSCILIAEIEILFANVELVAL